MTRDRRGGADRQEDVFGLMGQFVEGVATTVDQLMGPFGTVDFRMERRVVIPEEKHHDDLSETHIDVQVDGGDITVVADLAGVSKEHIEVRCDGRTVSIGAADDGHNYADRVRLPVTVDADSATATYNNGVLEVTLTRRSGDGDTVVDVE